MKTKINETKMSREARWEYWFEALVQWIKENPSKPINTTIVTRDGKRLGKWVSSIINTQNGCASTRVLTEKQKEQLKSINFPQNIEHRGTFKNVKKLEGLVGKGITTLKAVGTVKECTDVHIWLHHIRLRATRGPSKPLIFRELTKLGFYNDIYGTQATVNAYMKRAKDLIDGGMSPSELMISKSIRAEAVAVWVRYQFSSDKALESGLVETLREMGFTS